MTAFALLLAGGLLVMGSRTSHVLAAYVALSLAASVVIVPAVAFSPVLLSLFAVTLLLKAVVAPLAISAFVRANPAAADLRPSASLPRRLLVVLAFAAVAHGIAASPAFAGFPLGALPPFLAFCGVGLLLFDRNLIAHLIGLLVLETGVTLAGAILAPHLPEIVEMGATFDALIVTFIGLGLARAFVAHDPLLDVDALRSLRG